MSWASRRRFSVVTCIVIILLALSAAGVYFVMYKAPSCVDEMMNQTEEGIDCGPVCGNVCTATLQDPIVKFARIVTSNGRLDVVAYVENPNEGVAAPHAPFTIELIGSDGAVVATAHGTVNLPPREEVPVFVTNVAVTGLVATQALLSFDAPLPWVRDTAQRAALSASAIHIIGTPDAPRVEAMLTNPTVRPVQNIPVIAVVYDEQGTVIAATQTIAASIPAQESTSVVFVWNQPFSRTPGRVEVRAVLP